MDSFVRINIVEYRDSSFSETTDNVASEKRLRIFAGNKDAQRTHKEILSLLCTPTMVKELVIGFALSEGLIREQNKIEEKQTWCAERVEIFWKDDEVEVYLPVHVPDAVATLTSGCAHGITFLSNSSVSELPAISEEVIVGVDVVFDLYKEFQKKSDLFRLTGGVHSAALCDEKEIIVFSEDIGRHNAVDKIIGYAFLEQIPLKGKIMLLSGRISSEITMKAVRAQVPILVSRAAPTDMAIQIARKSGITLVGFLRGQRLNVYSKPERILVKS